MLKMDIKLSTNTSYSHSDAVNMKIRGDDVLLTYVYENWGSNKSSLDEHKGACSLIISGGRVRGRYFNGRGNSGDITSVQDNDACNDDIMESQ